MEENIPALAERKDFNNLKNNIMKTRDSLTGATTPAASKEVKIYQNSES